MSKEAFYFPHDCNARNDDKLIAVRMMHKAAGYATYFMILERLGESSDNMSVKDYNVIAFDLRVGADIVKSVVEDFGLFEFTEDGKHFFSNRFKVQADKRREKSEKAINSANARWGNNANAMRTQCDGNANKVKKSKEKKSKEDKIISSANAEENIKERLEKFRIDLENFSGIYPAEMLEAFFDYWTEPEQNKPNSRMRFELQKTWDLSRRLKTWYGNTGKFDKKSRISARNDTTAARIDVAKNLSKLDGDYIAGNIPHPE